MNETWSAGFRLLWWGQLASTFGSQIQYVALPLWVLSTTGSALASGAVFALETLPSIVLAPWAGVVADRFPRRRLLLWCDGLSALSVVVSLVGAAVLDSVPVVFTGVALMSAVGVVAGPGFQGMLHDIVPRADLPKAAARFAARKGMAAIIASPLGSFLFIRFGVAPTLLLNALSFALSAAMLLPRRPLAPRHPAPRRPPGDRPRMALGLLTVRADPRLRDTLLAELAFFLFHSGLSVVVMQTAFGSRDAEALSGWYLSAVGVSWVLVTAVFLPRWTPGPGTLLIAGATCVPLTALSALLVPAHPYPALVVCGLAGGCANAFIAVGASTAVQQRVGGDRIGQVTALRRAGLSAAQAASSLALPLLVALLPDHAVLIPGAVAVTAAVVLLLNGPETATAPPHPSTRPRALR